MESSSPYDAPVDQGMPQPPAYPDAPVVVEPGAIRVFGIMHLVIAAQGLFSILAGLFSMVFFPWFFQMLGTGARPGGAPTGKEEMMMMGFIEAIKPFTLVSVAFSTVLTVLLIMAGIGLLKGRESGRVMSIRYAWVSIATKLVSLVFTFTHVLPATKQIADTLYQGLPGGMSGVMGKAMQYSQVFGILMTFIYPVVVLCVMKGNRVREYLAGR